MKKKIAFIFGTRPEVIKLCPVILECVKREIDFFTVHTGQHYSHDMFKTFLEELKLPKPDYNLRIKSRAPYRQGDHTGRMMIELERIMLEELPDIVIVQGDTNTALAGGLTAAKISTTESFTGYKIRVGHVEAGLRSYDRTMPEEINRIITDNLSDWLFVPTEKERKIVIKEGIPREKVKVIGNTIVDAVYYGLKLNKNRSDLGVSLGLKKGAYILMTLHRQENVDNKKRLINILRAVDKVSEALKMTVVFPIHPRTVKMLRHFNIVAPENILLVDPCGFLEFLSLEKDAALIMSDSGGVQEEASILKVPCVTLRDSTERPETVEVGANIIAGHKPEDILNASIKMMKRKRNWENPFGNGKSAKKIIDALTRS